MDEFVRLAVPLFAAGVGRVRNRRKGNTRVSGWRMNLDAFSLFGNYQRFHRRKTQRNLDPAFRIALDTVCRTAPSAGAVALGVWYLSCPTLLARSWREGGAVLRALSHPEPLHVGGGGVSPPVGVPPTQDRVLHICSLLADVGVSGLSVLDSVLLNPRSSDFPMGSAVAESDMYPTDSR